MFKTIEKFRVVNGPIGTTSALGCTGFFVIPHPSIERHELRCQISDGMGWEHVSVSVAPRFQVAKRCPTWEEMCIVKNIFWDETDLVIQYHPSKEDYVNMHPHVLHLWRPIGVTLPKPDKLMVGVNLKHQPQGEESPYKGKKNIYACLEGHQTVTVDKDSGVTPMFLICPEPGCGQRATSVMYQCDQSLTPSREWYIPEGKELAKLKGPVLEHVRAGGMLLRKIEPVEAASA